jgi:fructose-bisphosphate aldolase class 1
MGTQQELQSTISALVAPGKGILAADESMATITKRFKALGIESTEETRRQYRSLLFTPAGIEEFIAGIILFEETLDQKDDDGTPLTKVLEKRGILTGIKVDKGTVPLPNAPGDLITQGLDGLGDRLETYKPKGARFAKWREVYGITDRNPTPLASRPMRRCWRAMRRSARSTASCRSSSPRSSSTATTPSSAAARSTRRFCTRCSMRCTAIACSSNTWC